MKHALLWHENIFCVIAKQKKFRLLYFWARHLSVSMFCVPLARSGFYSSREFKEISQKYQDNFSFILPNEIIKNTETTETKQVSFIFSCSFSFPVLFTIPTCLIWTSNKLRWLKRIGSQKWCMNWVERRITKEKNRNWKRCQATKCNRCDEKKCIHKQMRLWFLKPLLREFISEFVEQIIRKKTKLLESKLLEIDEKVVLINWLPNDAFQVS